MSRGVQFTEEMKGWLSFDEADYNQALWRGRVNGTSAKLHLTIKITDLDRFAADRNALAAAEGWFECDELGGCLRVEKGTFQLFPREPDPRHVRMRYRLFLRDQVDRPLTLTGFKLVEDDPNFDSYRDVTTLFLRLFSGHLAETGGEAGTEGGHRHRAPWAGRCPSRGVLFSREGPVAPLECAGSGALPVPVPARAGPHLRGPDGARWPAELPARPPARKQRLGDPLARGAATAGPGAGDRLFSHPRRGGAESPPSAPGTDSPRCATGVALARRRSARAVLLRAAQRHEPGRPAAGRGLRRLGPELEGLDRLSAEGLHA